MSNPIPARETSAYCGQYARAFDPNHLFEIFDDSERIARTSKVRDTAQSRFELAVECYHALAGLGAGDLVRDRMAALAREFPALAALNEAQGFLDRADGTKCATTQRPHLESAQAALANAMPGEGSPLRDELTRRLGEVRARLATLAAEPGAGASEVGPKPGGLAAEPLSPTEVAESVRDPVAPIADGMGLVAPSELAETRSAMRTAAPPGSMATPGAPGDVALRPPPYDASRATVEQAPAASRSNGTDLAVRIEAGVLPRVHPALIDNGFAIVHSVRVENDGSEPLRDLTLTVRAEPPFAFAEPVGVARVESEGAHFVRGLDLRLDRALFRDLTERSRATLTFELSSAEGPVAWETCEIDICPPSEWPGLEIYPEFLAAFVLPNDPAVQEVLAAARTVLAEWGDDPSLDGYQSKDPVRARRLAAAIYTGLQQQRLTYVGPPASFGERGQRVRLPSEVLEYRMGTCLDLSLLYAACLEQANLHPLVLVVQGHALAGVWLHDEAFNEPFLEEPLRLRNHLELGEAELVDVTVVSSRPSPSFDEARGLGRRHLEAPEHFLCAVDVHRARKGGVRPIGTITDRARTPGEEIEGVGVSPSAAPGTDDLAELERLRRASLERADTRRTEDRLDHWCRKLLDLTMRNRLLNFRPGKKTVALLCPDPAGLEDALADGQSFRMRQRPPELESESGLRRPGLSFQDAVEAVRELLEEEQRGRFLRADLAEDELDRRLVALYRDARTASEEGGTSNLYLAFGFLEYRETQTTTQTRRAPVLLIPVELHRSTVRGGITLSMGGDEPRINATLLEYLHRDHAIDVQGLDPLPKDESGLDVRLILQTLRTHIRGKDGWHVDEAVTLGFFSFAKILIWKDLMERREELLANALVNHLVHSYNEAWDDGVEFPAYDRLDDDHPATEVLCPRSADSSQLAAVLAAAKGKSFVLKGPPGTGKSQTITNLIAHCLAEGKHVLFVSEKMAALEVVHDRLKEVGLEEVCLELHSNKTKKKEVLEQLRQALHARAGAGGRDWEKRAGDLNGLRRDLNEYVRALHRRYPSGETPFAALARLTSLEDTPSVEMGWTDVERTTEERLAAARAAARGLAEAADRAGVGPEHPFLPVGHEDYTPQWQRDAEAALRELGSALEALSAAVDGARDDLGLAAAQPIGWAAHEALAEVCAHLLEVPAVLPLGLASAALQGGLEERAAPWFEVGRTVGELSSRLSSRYRELPTCLPLDDLHRLVQEAHTAWFLPAWSKRRRVLKALRSVSSRPKALRIESALADLTDARELRDREAQLVALADEATGVFGAAWRGADSEWDALEAAVRWTEALGARLELWGAASRREPQELLSAVTNLLEEGGLECSAKPAERLAALRGAWKKMSRPLGEVRDRLRVEGSTSELLGEGDGVAELTGLVQMWLDRWRDVPTWCAWLRARTEADRAGLTPIVAAVERGEVAAQQAVDAFERAYADAWYTTVCSREPVLARFLGTEHETRIARFRQLDDEVLRLTREELRRRVLARSATPGNAPASSEQGILQRELTKKTRYKAIRQLFREIPTLLPRLKPCLLMSPMSVAQYLESTRQPFDLLVFDEASQIPVWDAVGAIARARQLVVVGDPEQLPPTSFFDRADEEGHEDVVDDQESILDECLACRFPVLTLDWHYRSRHEDLIAFSNDRYYENRLVTFPSCDDEDLGVSFRFVEEGVYDRGKSRTNQPEARALVGEVVRRLKDQVLGRRSVGIVTFNQAQQQLIENLLDDERRRHPDLEPHFSEANPAAVFVKNLENVQGDERDAIMFSIGYGPDATGRVYMNFGPLTSAGGHRRLNVAVTRARREVVIFSSMRADQIPLERARAQGVQDLRLYLEYAERGPETLARALSLDPSGDVESLLEAQVKAAVEERGHRVHAQVGCSGYRIDLAIVDPERPGRYLLGVECDGAMYHSARTARDRDKLRQGVLEGLGWRLHRIWSTEWWRDRDGQLARLEEVIEDARRVRREPTEVAPLLKPIAAAPVSAVEPDRTPPVEAAEAHAAVVEESPGAAYVEADLGRVRGDQGAFYEPRSMRAIRNALLKLVEVEAPVSLDRAVRRIGALWGFERVRAKARKRIEGILRSLAIRVEDDRGEPFLWPLDADPTQLSTFRPSGPTGETRRQPGDVSTWELANAHVYVLSRFGGMGEDDLIREVGRLFDCARIGPKVRERVEGGLIRLKESGRVESSEDIVHLATSGGRS